MIKFASGMGRSEIYIQLSALSIPELKCLFSGILTPGFLSKYHLLLYNQLICIMGGDIPNEESY